MQPREAFGVFVRSLGVIVVAYALWNLGFAFSDAIGYTTDNGVETPVYVTSVATFSLIGLALLRGADIIVKFAYLGQSLDNEF